jgi:hypothetical protein
MDVRRLIRFMTVEVKTVRAGSQHSGHRLSIPQGKGLYAQRPPVLVRSNARAGSDSPTVTRWLNHDTMLLVQREVRHDPGGVDPDYESLTYFELTREQAAAILAGGQGI